MQHPALVLSTQYNLITPVPEPGHMYNSFKLRLIPVSSTAQTLGNHVALQYPKAHEVSFHKDLVLIKTYMTQVVNLFALAQQYSKDS